MASKPTYEELAVAISQCVYDELYFVEGDDPRTRKTVDDMFSSGFQIPAMVLRRLDILEPLNGSESRSIFTCEPPEFPEVIRENKSKGCSYDMMVLAGICLLEYHPHVGHLYEILTRAEVTQPDTDPPYDKGNRYSGHEKIRWTKKADLYNGLYEDWTDLVDSSKFDDPRLDP